MSASTVIAELPEHLAAMARFTLATGLRENNVIVLEWAQTDLEQRRAWIYADQGERAGALAVPLNAQAMVVLREQEGQHPTRVFVYDGKPFTRANNRRLAKCPATRRDD